MAREISDKQLAANRRNARRSIKSGDACGPRTPEGKERARFNALRPCPGLRSGNGLLARSVVVSTRDGPENRKQFERLLTQLRDKLNPDGILEEMLVEKIAVAYWRLRRALRVRLRRTKSMTISVMPAITGYRPTPAPSPSLRKALPSRLCATRPLLNASSIAPSTNCVPFKRTAGASPPYPRRNHLSTKTKNYETNPFFVRTGDNHKLAWH